ncbi:MAG: hypothetical protein OIN84_09185, partial [Candidatus Methanoperedens sp.]|nr:hypothetical protein [Candidatus Methanoperedens sp.]
MYFRRGAACCALLNPLPYNLRDGAINPAWDFKPRHRPGHFPLFYCAGGDIVESRRRAVGGAGDDF